MADGRIEKLLRGVPKARNVHIECVEQGGEDSYIVEVCPKQKGDGPHKYKDPTKRVLQTKSQTIKFLEEVL